MINYSSFLISFLSPGIPDLLFPIKAKNQYHAQAIGTDIFKFLGNHGAGVCQLVSRAGCTTPRHIMHELTYYFSDFKSTVRGALKMGNAVSLELKLCARPYMGFERFVLHWTPLKDEGGAVTWIVLTLGNEQRA